MQAGIEIQVQQFTPADSKDWAAFVEAHPKATLFHHVGWHDVIKQGLRHRPLSLVARCGRKIEGVLPLAEVKSLLFGHSLISTPGCVYGGVLSYREDVHAALIEHARALATKLGVDVLELRHTEDILPDWPTSDIYCRFRKQISGDDEINMKAVPRKQRAMVRKGINVGLKAETTADVGRFYTIYAESVRNLGTPVFPLRYFQTLADVFHEFCEMLIVTHDGKDIAGVMSFYYRDEVLPYYGGSRPVARRLYGNDFMYWALMCRAARHGSRIFDFGRSKKESGAFAFKKNWGFEPSPLYYQYYLVRADGIPNTNPNNPKYRYLIQMWKRLPLPLANLIGPMLSRHLG